MISKVLSGAVSREGSIFFSTRSRKAIRSTELSIDGPSVLPRSTVRSREAGAPVGSGWVFTALGALSFLIVTLVGAGAVEGQSFPPRKLLEEPGLEITVMAIDHQGKEAHEELSSLLAVGNRLRIEAAPPRGSEAPEAQGTSAPNTTIFRGDRDDFLVVDHSTRSFTLMDQDAIDYLAAQMQDAMRNLDEQVAQLPEEQRRLMMAAMMKNEAATVPNRVEKTSDKAEKSGFSCVRYEVYQGEEKVREVWIADWSQLPESADLRGALEGLETFFSRLTTAFESVTSSLTGVPAFDLAGESPFQDLKTMGGFPVLSRDFEDGELVAETLVVSVEEKQVALASFNPPDTYTRRPIGE